MAKEDDGSGAAPLPRDGCNITERQAVAMAVAVMGRDTPDARRLEDVKEGGRAPAACHVVAAPRSIRLTSASRGSANHTNAKPGGRRATHVSVT